MLYKVVLNRNIGITELLTKSYFSGVKVLSKTIIERGCYEGVRTLVRNHMRQYGFELIGSYKNPESECEYGYVYIYIVDLMYVGESNIFNVLKILMADEVRNYKINCLFQ